MKETDNCEIPNLPQPTDSIIIDESGAPFDEKDNSPIRRWIGFDKVEGLVYGK